MHFDLQYKHTFVLLYFALLCFPNNCVFYKLMVCGNPSSSKTIGAIFPTAFAHFVSLCHILIILPAFENFHYYCVWYGDLWSVIFDVTVVIILGHDELYPYKTAKLIHKCYMCSDSFMDHLFPLFLSSPWASLFLEIQQYWNWTN